MTDGASGGVTVMPENLGRPSPPARAVLLAWCAGGLTLLLVATGAAMAVANPHPPVGAVRNWGFRGYAGAQALVLSATGTVLAVRRPRELISWMLLAAALISALVFVDGEYAAAAVVRDLDLPGASAALWAQAWAWVVPMTLSTAFLFLRYPTGRVPTPSWVRVERLMVVGACLAAAGLAVKPGPLVAMNIGVNPLGVRAPWASALTAVGTVALAATVVVSLVSLVVRARHASPVERAQLRWLTFAGAVLIVTGVPSFALQTSPVIGGSWIQAVTSLAPFGIPVAITVAVLRYRLYEIDRLISRTLSYAVLTGLLVGTYLVVVTVVTRLLPSSSSLAVASSTLAVAALFQPLRRRVQASVDRRFNRARYDAEHTLEGFRARLRDEVDLDSVRAELIRVIHETLQPVSAGVWLRTIAERKT